MIFVVIHDLFAIVSVELGYGECAYVKKVS